MISKLCISNYILIEDLTIEFEKGLNVITGETGAGKSIILSAIAFVLGQRTDKNVIRNGCKFARVEIQFEKIGAKICDLLLDMGIDIEEGLIISRKLALDGKNDIRINGQIVNVSMLKQITAYLLEIYGQHAYQILLDESKHIDFVDAIIAKDLAPYLSHLHEYIAQKREIENRLKEFEVDDAAREREKQMYAYQIEEITGANLQIDEEEQLRNKMQMMKNTQHVILGLGTVNEIINGTNNDNILNMLYQTKHAISSLVDIDKNISQIYQRLESVNIELDDIAQTTQEIVSKYDFSQEDFEQVDERLDLINKLKRKYGFSITEILDFCENAKQKMKILEDSDGYIAKQKQKLQSINEEINKICAKITKLRTQSSQNLKEMLLSQLDSLGIKNAQFEIKIEPCPLSLRGMDKVVFWFSANLGHNIMPLSKVISGGEMSRFMLAFDIVFNNQTGTIIFDEIDAGISGEVSHDVAIKLYQLSRQTQVLVITHLPAICAMADANFRVQKSIVENSTITTVDKLTAETNLQEIARLSGLVGQSQIAIKSAQELKAICNQYKHKIVAN
ncbi:MAG: DNA repair protein RecN [Clostridia bacterium]|nr:DNA repair protein RecN [Clostridia bacterium]